MTALDARAGVISLGDASKLVNEYEGKKPASLSLFLDYVGLSEEEFNQIVKSTCVPPHKPNFDNIEDAPKTWDFDRWFKEEL